MISTGGHTYRTPITAGHSDSDSLLGPAFSMLSAPAGVQDDSSIALAAPTAGLAMPQGSPAMWLVGLVGVAVVLHFVHREAAKKADRPIAGIEAASGINIWNFVNWGIAVSLFQLTLKVGANRWAAGSTFASVANAI